MGDAQGHVLDDASVEVPHLVPRPASRHREEGQIVKSAARGSEGHVPGELDQLAGLPAPDRHLRDGGPLDELPDGRVFRFEERSRAGHLDGLGDLANLQLDGDRLGQAGFHDDAGLVIRLEADGLAEQFVGTRLQQGKVESSRDVALRRELNPRAGVADRDIGCNDHRASGVRDGARQAGLLRVDAQRAEREQERKTKTGRERHRFLLTLNSKGDRLNSPINRVGQHRPVRFAAGRNEHITLFSAADNAKTGSAPPALHPPANPLDIQGGCPFVAGTGWHVSFTNCSGRSSMQTGGWRGRAQVSSVSSKAAAYSSSLFGGIARFWIFHARSPFSRCARHRAMADRVADLE